MRTLLSLDDRILADIGLRRAEVAAVVSGQLPLSQLSVHGPIGPNDGWRPPSVPPGLPERSEAEPWDAAA